MKWLGRLQANSYSHGITTIVSAQHRTWGCTAFAAQVAVLEPQSRPPSVRATEEEEKKTHSGALADDKGRIDENFFSTTETFGLRDSWSRRRS